MGLPDISAPPRPVRDRYRTLRVSFSRQRIDSDTVNQAELRGNKGHDPAMNRVAIRSLRIVTDRVVPIRPQDGRALRLAGEERGEVAGRGDHFLGCTGQRARVTRGGDGVDQALEFGFASMRPPPLIARRPIVIAVVHLKPVTGRVLTAPTGTPRPRRASPPKRPCPPLCCRARFAADSKSHQIGRGMSALEPTTNLTTTTPILPEQRRSAGCFSYPLWDSGDTRPEARPAAGGWNPSQAKLVGFMVSPCHYMPRSTIDE